jgi:peptidylamidoglycolate lyase
MNATKRACVLVLVLLGLAGVVDAQQKGGEDETGPYEVVPGWPHPLNTDGWKWGITEGVWAESPDRVWVLERGEIYQPKPPTGTQPRVPALNFEPRHQHLVLIFDRNGNLVDSWEKDNDKFKDPHRIRVNPADPEHHIWFTDEESNQVTEFTHDGKLVLSLGEFGVQGTDQNHFFRPTDVAFLRNGDFLVSDGRGGTRVVKFPRMEST